MVIDFSKLKTTLALDTVLEPRKIFSSLPRKDSKYNYPRDVQTQVLEKWFIRRNEKDLVIKMNTGSGKTVVGLLILKSCLNEKKGPAVYVVPDKYLTQQVIQEAKMLGIEFTEKESDPNFISGKAILITNVSKVFNGKSTFGLLDEGEKIKIGSLIIDDAHSCIAIIKEKFTLKINNDHESFDKIFALFKEDLRSQSESSVLDIESSDPNAIVQVPFWAWKNKQKELVKILHKYKNDEDFLFVWPLIKDVLPLCNCVISGKSIEVKPRLLPTDIIPSFENASRRIYMTATLSDDGILVSDFLANAATISETIVPNSGDDLGDRLILNPQELNPLITDDEIKNYIKKISTKHNVVVIVPSNNRANFWEDIADQTLTSKNMAAGIDKLKKGHVGVSILVNRYDGIDLPDSACRILVIDGLPEVQGLIERVDQSLLDGSEQFIKKQIHKIEQGMGRGVRSNDDYCVVLLMGNKLTQKIHHPAGEVAFTPATKAQLNLSKQMAEQLQGKSLTDLHKAIEMCLKRDSQWVSISKSVLVEVSIPKQSHIDEESIQARKAFDLARKNQFQEAVNAVNTLVTKTSDLKARGYYKLIKAEYLHHSNPADSQALLLSALEDNKRVLKPIHGIQYVKLTPPTLSQINLITKVAKQFRTSNDYIVHINSICEDLVYKENCSNEFEAAVEELGTLLGFNSQRPEKDFGGKGPDGCWAIGDLNYLVIECKNGATTSTIAKTDCDQLSGAMNWFSEKYDSTCISIPIMFHPKSKVHALGTPHKGMRVVTEEKLQFLKTNLQNFAAGMAASWGELRSEKVVDRLVTSYHLNHAQFISTFSVNAKK